MAAPEQTKETPRARRPWMWRICLTFVLVVMSVLVVQYHSSSFANHSPVLLSSGGVRRNLPAKQHNSLHLLDNRQKAPNYVILDVVPHDPDAFTQGLTYDGKYLYESTGLFGRSSVRIVDPSTGKVLDAIGMDHQQFGEGMTYFKTEKGRGRLIQLTWRSKQGFIYDCQTLDVIRQFTFETSTGEGWGITHDPDAKEFIVSDGSSEIAFWDQNTLQPKRRIQVMQALVDEDNGALLSMKIRDVNELEWDNGSILANVWREDIVLRIDPGSGLVTQVYDFTGLYNGRSRDADTFNGISSTGKKGEFWVTGKRWPNMYRVRLLEDNMKSSRDTDNA